MADRSLAWSVAGGYATVPAGMELGEFGTYEDLISTPGYHGGLTQEAAYMDAGIELDETRLAVAPYNLPYEVQRPPPVKQTTLPVGWTPPPMTVSGSETNGLGVLPPVNGGVATPMAFPLIAGAGMIAGRFLSLGALKALLRSLGPKILKAIIGVAAFKEFMDLLGINAPDETQIRIKAGGKRRYSIGSNPRVRTLQKVSRHCQRLLKRHEKVIREFLPKKAPRYGIPPARALSAIEKAAIRGSG